MTQLKRIFSVVILFALPLVLNAQKDSSLQAIRTEFVNGDDTTRVMALYELSGLFMNLDRDSAEYYAREGLDLEGQIIFPKVKAHLLARLGMIYVGKGDFASAQKEFAKALEVYTDEGMLIEQSRQNLRLGNLYRINGEYARSLQYYIDGLRIVDSIGYLSMLPDFHNNIGNLYFDMADFPSAMHHYEQSEKFTVLSGRVDMIPHVKLTMAGVAELEKNTTKARQLALEVIDLVDSIPYSINLVPAAYRMLGHLAYESEDYRSSLNYYEKMVESLNDTQVGYRSPNSLEGAKGQLGIGKAHLALNNVILARRYLKIAYEIADSTNHIAIVNQAAKYLSTVEERLGNTSEALEYYKTYKITSDSLSNVASVQKTTRLQMQYVFDNEVVKRQTIQDLRNAVHKRKEFLYVGVALVTVLVLLITILFINLLRNKIKRVQLAKQNLRKDLDYKNRELASNVLYLLKKNELLLNVSDKLKKARIGAKVTNKSAIDEIVNAIYISSKDLGWKDFELRFKEVHSNYYNSLTKKYPNLTTNELRLCAFIKLNMSTKDISAITFQSNRSIVVARSRLKNKLGISENERLSTFLNKVY